MCQQNRPLVTCAVIRRGRRPRRPVKKTSQRRMCQQNRPLVTLVTVVTYKRTVPMSPISNRQSCVDKRTVPLSPSTQKNRPPDTVFHRPVNTEEPSPCVLRPLVLCFDTRHTVTIKAMIAANASVSNKTDNRMCIDSEISLL